MRSILKTILERSVEGLERIMEYVSGNRQRTFVADDIDLQDPDWFASTIEDHDKVIAMDEEYRTSNLIQLMDAYTLRRDILYTYSERPWHISNGYDSGLGNDFRSGYIESYYKLLRDNEEEV